LQDTINIWLWSFKNCHIISAIDGTDNILGDNNDTDCPVLGSKLQEPVGLDGTTGCNIEEDNEQKYIK
jgi:isopentenyl diphosphate isomerase/L-lactate dehydrogenase-like FMN-dependent dehydrogenase